MCGFLRAAPFLESRAAATAACHGSDQPNGPGVLFSSTSIPVATVAAGTNDERTSHAVDACQADMLCM
jgi:hypothetical protein